MKKIWILIPVYNEQRNVGKLLDEIFLRFKQFGILVVDDGSSDMTAKVVSERKFASSVSYPDNRGKGHAKQVGFNRLLEKGSFEAVITMDGDNQHSPEDLPKFVDAYYAGKGDIIIGNRLSNHRGMPILRYIVNLVMSWLNSLLTGVRLRDSQCDFRLIGRRVLEKVKISSHGFEGDTEFLIRAVQEGFRIGQVKIRTIYFSNRKSKIRAIRDTFLYFKTIFSLRKSLPKIKIPNKNSP